MWWKWYINVSWCHFPFLFLVWILMGWGHKGPCRQGQHHRDGEATRQRVLDTRHCGAAKMLSGGLLCEKEIWIWYIVTKIICLGFIYWREDRRTPLKQIIPLWSLFYVPRRLIRYYPGCTWMRITCEWIDWTKQVGLPSVSGPHPISWKPEEQQKAERRELLLPDCWAGTSVISCLWTQTEISAFLESQACCLLG